MTARARTIEDRDGLGRIVPWLLAGILLLAAACRDPGREIVAFVGDDRIYEADLEAYLRSNLAPVAEGAGGSQTDRVKSRLLDALVDERLLVGEARRRGIEVEDAELEAHLANRPSEDDSVEPAPDAEARRRAARTRLIVRKLLDAVRNGLPAPDEEQLNEYVELHRERLVDRFQRVRVRSLRFGSRDEAQAARDAIVGDTPDSAAIRSAMHDRPSSTLDLTRPGFPERMRATIAPLEPGQISEPFEHGGSVYLFMMVARPDGPPDEQALLHLARNELADLRQRYAETILVETLRDRTAIRIAADLPFRYVPPRSGPPTP